MIQIDDLKIHYPDRPEPAVNGLSLHVQKGEVFGLLGPNGAGKTSTIKSICRLISPLSGKIAVLGEDVQNNQDILVKIGLAPQEIALYPTLTARENLKFLGDMYMVDKNDLSNRIDEYLKRFELDGRANDQVNTFSGGMKRRLNLIAAMLHNPELLILDEPTTGVDVQSRAIIHAFLTEANKAGLTIIYTSHILDEAEKLCTRVAIMDHGKLLALATPQSLKSTHNADDLESVFIALTGRKSRDH